MGTVLAEPLTRKIYGPRRLNPDFRYDLEGLRAVAILLVFLHHAGLPLYGGVDMSFVLSGFFVTSKFVERVVAGKPVELGKFFASRARRILPLAGVVIAATVFASWLFLPAFRLKGIGYDAFFAAVSGINYRLALDSTDYFASDPSPLQHYWSLAGEEQFYIVWAFLFVGVAWLGRRIGRVRSMVGIFLLAVIGVSLWISIVVTPVDQSMAYFSAHSRAWELAFGCLVGVLAEFCTRIPRSLGAVMTWAGLATIGVGSYFISHSSAIPGSVMLWPVVGTALIIAGGCSKPHSGAEMLLARRPVRFVGRLSYGWYLWHWPVLVILPFAFGRTFTLAENILAGVGAFCLALVTYYLVERPVRNDKSLVEQPRRGIGFGLQFAAAGAAAAGILLAGTVAYARPAADTASYANGTKIVEQVAISAQATHLTPLVVGDLPTAKDDLYSGCIADIKEAHAVPCLLGDANGKGQAVLLGSSLAWQWIPPVSRIAQQGGMRLAVFTKGSCPAERYAVDITIEEGNVAKTGPYTQCEKWRNEAYAQIAVLRPQLVIMSSRVTEQATPEAIAASVHYFQELGARVVVIGETPSFTYDVPQCLTLHYNDVQQCVGRRDEIFADTRKSAMAAEVAAVAGAKYIDPLEWLCTDTQCPTVIDNRIVYHDAHHLSARFSAWLGAVLKEQIKLK